ncbi:sigma-E factor negative regulatory protein [Acidovorax sp. SUPP2539]|uniref:sigma-E factor negative regulatory protein n=1 Tax=Acidovorax sp. SUPP2539 TaxID=2920878 RepID=UPI0023DE25C8|nr:sigma-E factor negative regulatory protein [Acidovorax sp. SUPP2539]GKS90334.1 sigma-E factor negative regulatory protein [Acidovorax sp. SUPP2539]
MNDDLKMREHLSALADGQLRGQEFGQAVDYASSNADGSETWQMYHLIGDVLRSSELARPVNSSLVDRLRSQIEAEGIQRPPLVASAVVQGAVAEVVTPALAANASVFRWKMAAGFASLAAVGAIGWTAMTGIQSGAESAQMASAVPVTAAPAAVAVADATEGGGAPQVMIRDPRLDELLAAHKQFGNTSALQMPAGFLRNATFEAPAR